MIESDRLHEDKDIEWMASVVCVRLSRYKNQCSCRYALRFKQTLSRIESGVI